MNNLLEAVNRYIEAKQHHTACMQQHFRQLCSRCKYYAGCPVYNEYVDAWIDLQKSAREEW